MSRVSNKVLCIAFLVAVAIVMYVLNRLTPLFCDDWHYAFIFGTQEPIQTLGDIFRSQWTHYFEFNGRFVVHWFVQLFDGIVGKGLFNVLNALVFVLFLYAVALVVTDDKNRRYQVVSVAFMLVFLLMSGFKYVFLWLSGSLNYLWVGTALLCFHYLLEKERVPSWLLVPLCLFGIVCGWSNEALAVGLGAAYFVYYAFHRNRLTKHRVCMLAGFYLGALLLVFSPASVHRAMDTAAKQIPLLDRLIDMQNLRLFFLMLAVVLVRAIFGKAGFMDWVKGNLVFILATVLTFVFILFTGFYYSHSRFGIELFSLVLILRAVDWNRVGRSVVSVGNIAVLAFAVYVITVSGKCFAVTQQELSRVVAGDETIATASPIRSSSYLYRFVLDYQGLGFKDGIDDVKYYGEDDWIPKYYGKNDVVVYFYPRAFMDDLQANHDLYRDFRTLEGLPFYAKILSPGEGAGYAELTYGPSRFGSLPWPLNRFCAKMADEVDHDISMVRVMPVNGEQFVFVHKLRPGQDDRLKSITLKE